MVAYLIGPVFLATAAWFLAIPEGLSVPATSPTPSTATISAEYGDVRVAPPRPTMDDPPTIDVAGFAKKCSECHSLFTSPVNTPLILSQHRDIVQAHGMNDRCLNCHDNDDRGMLVLPGGRTITFAETPRLCATCHGTTYRDWQRGMHGRTTGSWDTSRPERGKLICTQCHDPHAPAFAPLVALPGPDTLRMGEQHQVVHDPAAKRNPLRQWSRSDQGAHP